MSCREVLVHPVGRSSVRKAAERTWAELGDCWREITGPAGAGAGTGEAVAELRRGRTLRRTVDVFILEGRWVCGWLDGQ